MSPVYTLLEVLAHALRQLWVRLTQDIAHDRGLKPTAWVGELPLTTLLQWLADHLAQLYPSECRIDLRETSLEASAKC